MTTYRGNCHCGGFVFEAKSGDLNSVTECNCSICVKKGYLWFVPSEPIHVLKGSESLKEYTFGPEKKKHVFCSVCGTPLMGRECNRTLVNARAIQDLDCWKLKLAKFDGRKTDLGYAHAPPIFEGPEPSAVLDDGKLYTGSCHCGDVTFAIRVKALDHTYPDKIVECNCSICQRGAYIWIYTTKDQVSVHGRENLTYYVFGSTIVRKAFCRECGVHIMNEVNPLSDEEVAALSIEDQAIRPSIINLQAVTLRALNKFELNSIKAERFDGWNLIGKKYLNP